MVAHRSAARVLARGRGPAIACDLRLRAWGLAPRPAWAHHRGVKPYLLKVADIMSTALITVRASELVTEAHAEMESGAVRHLPVVDDHGRLVGVLSDRDLLRAATAVERHAPRVSEIMSPDVVKVGPDTPAHQAAALMLELTINSVAVVDEEGALVGIVTATDFLDLARRALLGLPLER